MSLMCYALSELYPRKRDEVKCVLSIDRYELMPHYIDRKCRMVKNLKRYVDHEIEA